VTWVADKIDTGRAGMEDGWDGVVAESKTEIRSLAWEISPSAVLKRDVSGLFRRDRGRSYYN
jgi:hypothetical protein